jgi:membrane protein YdbS with pleckstrin-like domain
MMRRWRKMSLTSKLSVCFVAYVVVGFPALLFGGGAILSNMGIPSTTSAGQSPAVAAYFIILVGPVFILPIIILVVGLRSWRRGRKPSTESIQQGKIARQSTK